MKHVVFFVLLWSNLVSAAEKPFDPFFWLEEVEGEPALTWVKQHNARALSTLEGHPLFPSIFREIKDIVLAPDRVPFGSFYGGYFWNFWQDEKNPRGIWRRTTLDEYKKDNPAWEILLDLDALSGSEGKNWIFKKSQRLEPDEDRVLISLSDGGKDAVEIREFSISSRKFIDDGFFVPEGKTEITIIDRDNLLIGAINGPESKTHSGYPRTLRWWKRGEPLENAKLVFTVDPESVSVGAAVFKSGEGKNEEENIVLYDSKDFFHSEFHHLDKDGATRKLSLPLDSELIHIGGGKIYFQTKSKASLGSREIPANAILRMDVKDTSLDRAEVLFTADASQSIESVDLENTKIYVSILENVRGKVIELTEGPKGQWTQQVLPFPNTGVLSFSPKKDGDNSDLSLLTYTDHLTPTSQYLVHQEDKTFRLEKLKAAQHRFDSSKYEVRQNFAISKDGTKVPYFLIQPKNMVLDGSHPTLLYGYGGFEVSMTPRYLGSIGKVWLERGGVYVVANIRGGGEFGPEWHQAALKHHRQRAFDDFIAVSEDLVARKVTSPAHLGIQGGSNGGLLVGATMVQRPELFNAAIIQVPLLDMVRFSKLLAGASWMGEYGDPDNASDCEYLLSYSPYHNVKPGVRYPAPFFRTSTKDDRVHPAHARKMAARMEEQGHPFTYFENTDGGHAGSAKLEETARMMALEFVYLWNRLK